MPSAPAPQADRFGLTDHEIARAIGASVDWVRKDRLTRRLLPFYKVGSMVRYNPQRVLEALANLEEGGTALPKRKAVA